MSCQHLLYPYQTLFYHFMCSRNLFTNQVQSSEPMRDKFSIQGYNFLIEYKSQNEFKVTWDRPSTP